jgi:NitT/TauT family transport system substrate-binding protein
MPWFKPLVLVMTLTGSLVFPPLLAAQPIKLRVGTNFPASTESVVFNLARDAGVLKKHDITVDVVYIAGGTLSMQALIGQNLELLCSGGTPFLLAYLQGAPVKMIGGVDNRFPYTFVAREASAPGQLRGKKIGISRFGSTDDFAVKLALAEFGLNPKEVNIVQVGSSGARATALTSGAIDAATLSPELTHFAKKQGFHVLMDFVERDMEYQQVGIISRQDFLKNQADSVRRLMRAYFDSVRYYKTHKEEALQKSMQLLKLQDREVAEIGYAYRTRSLPDDGRPTVKGLRTALDGLIAENPKAKSINISDVIDLSYVP